MHRRECLMGLAAVATCASVAGRAQMLAHPGWKGNGFESELWWKAAVFYGAMSFEGELPSLDLLQTLGADALVLFDVPDPGAADGQGMDKFSTLASDASRRGIRLVVELYRWPEHPADYMRFWMRAGVAGFLVNAEKLSNDEAGHATIREMRHAVDAVGGQHILMGLLPEGTSDIATWYGKHDEFHVVLRSLANDNADTVQATLTQIQTDRSGAPVLLQLGTSFPSLEQQRLAASVVLTLPVGFFLHPQNVTMPQTAQAESGSLFGWTRDLIALRRSNSSLHNGDLQLIATDTPQTLAWMRHTRSGAVNRAPVIVACNLSEQPATLHLRKGVNAAGARGSFMRALMRTDGQLGGMNLDAVVLPPYGVFIGEVRL